jgi:hypothetical protein
MSSRFSSLRTGPKLSRRLAAVSLGQLPDEQLLDYLHAETRQLSQQQARVWAAMAEVGRRAPFAFDHGEVWTPERRFDSAVCEIVAELRVSKPYATHELEYAQAIEALPTVAAALRAGNLDRNRALVLVEVCAELSDEHRDQLLAEVLPVAGSLPAATLRAKAQRLAIALDPDLAERRYREAVRDQKVVCYIAEDGTVTLAGENLPAEEALAAKAHVWALAKAAKRAGAHASSDTLRATLFTGLQTPRFLGLTQLEIIAELVKQFPKPVVDGPGEPTAPAAQPAPPASPEPAVPSGVELRVGLACLMGLTDEPGDVAGTGPLIAPVARQIAEAQRRGEWRYAIVDSEGQLIFNGISRHRPAGYPTGGAKGGIVELHVPTHLLDPAFIEEHPDWAPLLTDVAQQYERRAPIVQDPAARTPGKPLRRRVEITHRYCVFPSCRRPAADSQADHRFDHAKGGVTLEPNLGPLCERHHDLKTRWGWRLVKRDDTNYVWISPLGRRHLVKIEPVAPPLPDPPDTNAA